MVNFPDRDNTRHLTGKLNTILAVPIRSFTRIRHFEESFALKIERARSEVTGRDSGSQAMANTLWYGKNQLINKISVRPTVCTAGNGIEM